MTIQTPEPKGDWHWFGCWTCQAAITYPPAPPGITEMHRCNRCGAGYRSRHGHLEQTEKGDVRARGW